MVASTGTTATWDFELVVRLPDGGDDGAAWLDALFEAGCDDALVGVGRRGEIALDFSRQAPSLEDAVNSAIAAVRAAIPNAELDHVNAEPSVSSHSAAE